MHAGQNRLMHVLRAASVLRLNPDFPPLWRDAEVIQFGIDGHVTVHMGDAWQEPLLGELRAGIPAETYDVVAHRHGAPRAAARELLARLAPVLQRTPPAKVGVRVDAREVAEPRAQLWAQEAAADAGFIVRTEGEPHVRTSDITLVLVEGAAAACRFADLLCNDRAHLPIAFEIGGTTVGPLVRPGTSPCLSCRDEHERARDAAWPLLHAQLVGRSAGSVAPTRIIEAVGLAARLINEHDADPETGRMVRISADGRRRWRAVRFHEACRCRDRSSRSPREIVRASGHRVLRYEPTSAPVFAQLA